MRTRRVVVTGLGAVTPLGLSVPETWAGIIAGKSGVQRIPYFDPSPFASQIAGIVKNFDPATVMPGKDVRRLDVFIQYGMAASAEAIQDAGLSESSALDPTRVGVMIGSGIGGIPNIEATAAEYAEGGARRISPFFIPGTIINTVGGYVSMHYGYMGPNVAPVSACATANHAIGLAMRSIIYGDADVIVAGGSEMAVSPLSIGGFSAARALSTRNDDPEGASRPWDKDRDGFVLAEGAGILVLEEYEHAKRRGAKIYAELSGFGMSADAYHLTSPDPDCKGFIAAMQHALQDASMNPEAIQYINAHGTSTQMGDVLEATAIKKAFGDHAYRLSVSSTKSMTGHLLGGAAGIEAIFSILAIRDNIAPPTINLHTSDEGCDLDFVPNTAKEMPINAVLSDSFGFGGTNTAIIFQRV